jgi:hypothetical protein
MRMRQRARTIRNNVVRLAGNPNIVANRTPA